MLVWFGNVGGDKDVRVDDENVDDCGGAKKGRYGKLCTALALCPDAAEATAAVGLLLLVTSLLEEAHGRFLAAGTSKVFLNCFGFVFVCLLVLLLLLLLALLELLRCASCNGGDDAFAV